MKISINKKSRKREIKKERDRERELGGTYVWSILRVFQSLLRVHIHIPQQFTDLFLAWHQFDFWSKLVEKVRRFANSSISNVLSSQSLSASDEPSSILVFGSWQSILIYDVQIPPAVYESRYNQSEALWLLQLALVMSANWAALTMNSLTIFDEFTDQLISTLARLRGCSKNAMVAHG